MRERKPVLMLALVILIVLPNFTHAQVIYGPTKFHRSIQVPNIYTDGFEVCNIGATYRLIVENGEAGTNRLSSASLYLNGKEVIKEWELNQRLERIEKEVSLKSQNTLQIKLQSGPDGFIRVSIQCVSGCLEVKIDSPPNGDSINKSRALIKGTLINAHGEVGVKVNGIFAQTHGTGFAALVPIHVGKNTITATATDPCGFKAADTITINTETIQDPIRLIVIPSSGIPTLNVAFEVEAYLNNPISSYSWDLNGDGIPEQTGEDLSNVTAQYQDVGIYFPKVTIKDTQGNTFEETTIVNVLSIEEMDALLKGKWEGMKDALEKKNIEKAISYFSPGSKERYKGIFTALFDKLPTIASKMQEIQLIYIKDGMAKYRIRRVEDTGEVTYYIYFELDENGLWKIRQF